jgi:hypothetical protein
MVRIRARTSLDMGGRPGLLWRDLPQPEKPEAFTVPPDDGFRLNYQ